VKFIKITFEKGLFPFVTSFTTKTDVINPLVQNYTDSFNLLLDVLTPFKISKSDSIKSDVLSIFEFSNKYSTDFVRLDFLSFYNPINRFKTGKFLISQIDYSVISIKPNSKQDLKALGLLLLFIYYIILQNNNKIKLLK
jgi:uncharacterized membrane protein